VAAHGGVATPCQHHHERTLHPVQLIFFRFKKLNISLLDESPGLDGVFRLTHHKTLRKTRDLAREIGVSVANSQ
jgi:hypothetical protein